jgi:hypothetical protein
MEALQDPWVREALGTVVAVVVASWYAARERRKLRDALAARDEAIAARLPLRDVPARVVITGRGGACPECLKLFPTLPGFTHPGGLGDHILAEHPASRVADDVRYLRSTQPPASMS